MPMNGSVAHRRVLASLALLSLAALTGGPAKAFAAADPVPLATDCWSNDNGLPLVSSVQLGATDVDVRRGPVPVPVTVQVEDTGGPGPATGISRVSVAVGVPPAAKQDHVEIVRLDLEPVDTTTWSGTVTIPGVGSGRTWSVFEVRATDGAGNTRSMESSYFASAPWSPEVSIVRPRNSVPPAVLAFHATAQVDVRRRPGYVEFRAHVVDPDEAATARVLVRVNRSLGDGASQVVETQLRRVSGTPNDGLWRGRLHVRRGTPAGSYRLTVWMSDALTAYRSAWWGPLRRHGQDWRFVVRSHSDLVPPALSRVVMPSTVDLRESDRSVDVRLHVVDPGRGTAGVVVSRLADERTHWTAVRARLVSGTRRDGWWLAALPFSRCTSNAGDREVAARLTDRLGNVQDVQVGILDKLVGDHRGPVWRTSGFGNHDAGPAGPLVVSFDESAFGVTPDSLVATISGHPVQAPWVCTDPNGAAVDCATGPVKTAELQTSVRPAPGTTAAVLVNPEHCLDLRDASGNPASPRGGGEYYVWSG
jgi:hypothetical protein